MAGDYLEKKPTVFEHWKNIAEMLFRGARIGTGTVTRELVESVAISMKAYILKVLEQIKESGKLPEE